MAIVVKARVRDPRDLVLVWLDDPSVGGDEAARTAYLEDGDTAHLSLDGRETKFHVRLLDGERVQRVRESIVRGSLAFVWAAFSLGVRRVSGWVEGDGVPRDLPRDRWLADLPFDCRDAIGNMIYDLSIQTFPAPPEASIPLPLPPAP